MKISIKQYAQSLYEVVSESEDSNVQVAIKNFISILKEHRQINKADKIIVEFKKIWNQERGIVEGELVSARELGSNVTELLNSQIIKLLNAEEAQLKNKVDKDILGGFVIKLGDTVIDGSIKNQLNKLKSKLSN
ncbi:MAG: ATP synthase F1 subunit delta [Patescibacteria group bacterium]|jgi:F-type H+-transporting ATPase subunit delta